MPKGTNQKLKLYYLGRIMLEKTDDEHMITMQQIKDELLKYDVTADRRSLYDDMETLKDLGLDIIGIKDGKNYYYHVVGKRFELAEMKLLVDAIQSSKFITKRKSSELIKKLEYHVSQFEASQLNRQVYMSGRVKSMNESIYYNVDAIHSAINSNNKIRFEYMKWTLDKKLTPLFDGYIETSPWFLLCDNENYYLVGYSSSNNILKHYRVDKMKGIQQLDEKREGKDLADSLDPARYVNSQFHMFDGNYETVKLRVDNELIGVVLDRFGTDIPIYKESDEVFSTNVDVAVSSQFFGWLAGLGDSVKIVAPENVADMYKEYLNNILKRY